MKTTDDIVDLIQSQDTPATLYTEKSEVVQLAQKLCHEDIKTIISADFPTDDPEEISTPILILSTRDGVVALVQDNQQVTVSPKQLDALVEYAKTRKGA